MSNFGINFLNVNQHEIFLKSIEIKHQFGFRDEIQQKLTNYYIDELKPNLIRQFGSSDLLGNPRAMRRNITKGYREIAKLGKIRPREGLE